MTRQQQSARLARYNRAVVLDLVRRLGPVSTSELAQRSGLAVSSVMNVVASLTRRDLVRSVGVGPSTGGRRPTLIELKPNAQYAVGVNIRVTVVEAVLLDLVGDIAAETALPLQGGKDPESVTATVVEAVDQVVRLAQVDPALVLGAGVGFPGLVTGGDTAVGAPAFPDWRNVPLARQLERKLGVPVTLENDANLGALAEYRHGVGRACGDCDSLIYIYADHGIGQGIVVDGKLYRGADGLAGELGHIVIDVDGRQCVCGNYGCLEALASIGSVIRRTVVAAKLGGATTLSDRFEGDWESVSYSAISEAVAGGDPVATAAVEEAIAYLAVGIANVIRQFRPQILVLGGQFFDQGPGTFERLLAALEGRPSFFDSAPTRVVIGELGSRAPSIGAGTLILEHFFGIAHQVMSSEPLPQAAEPAFEDTLVWPRRAEEGILLTRSSVKVVSAGNLQPGFHRVRAGEPIKVTVDVLLGDCAQEDATQVKALLHWDRVSLFGGNWPSPKNSPMQLLETNGRKATYGLTLGSLPPGKYEFTAHVLGANDIWVRADAPGEVNGRIEVLANRSSGQRPSRGPRKEGHQPPVSEESKRPSLFR